VVINTAASPTVGQEYTQQKPSSSIIILRSFSLSFVRRTLPFDIIHHHHAFQKQTFVLNKQTLN